MKSQASHLRLLAQPIVTDGVAEPRKWNTARTNPSGDRKACREVELPAMHAAREDFAVASVGEDLLVLGGTSIPDGDALASAERLRDREWTPLPPLARARSRFVAVALDDGPARSCRACSGVLQGVTRCRNS